jgi:hypothetical protein
VHPWQCVFLAARAAHKTLLEDAKERSRAFCTASVQTPLSLDNSNCATMDSNVRDDNSKSQVDQLYDANVTRPIFILCQGIPNVL